MTDVICCLVLMPVLAGLVMCCCSVGGTIGPCGQCMPPSGATATITGTETGTVTLNTLVVSANEIDSSGTNGDASIQIRCFGDFPLAGDGPYFQIGLTTTAGPGGTARLAATAGDLGGPISITCNPYHAIFVLTNGYTIEVTE